MAQVIRTLVIGLGSTGTEICDELAKRIEWEVGSLDKAPWVRFLCIETDAQKSSRFNGTPDFVTLTISNAEWLSMQQNPELFDPEFAFTQWADIPTLQKVPSVTSGAAHNRMVGRLSLLYTPNFNKVQQAITARYKDLTSLKPVDGYSFFSTLDNTGKTVEQIRVVVVGTLSGGTASGTISDLAIIIRRLVAPECRVMGLFSVPHTQFDNALVNTADLRKTNVYHALMELNYYSLTDRPDRYVGIKHPNTPAGTDLVDPNVTPFDVFYVVTPRANTLDDISKLKYAMADRVFVNIFVPVTDPMAKVIDGGGKTPPRGGRSFAFSTFGLSTIEYPARQIAEACKYRLLSYSLDQWRNRPHSGQVGEALDGLGLTIPALLEEALKGSDGTSIKPTLRGQAQAIAKQKDASAARQEYAALVNAFNASGKGAVGALAFVTLRDGAKAAIKTVLDRLREYMSLALADYNRGPADVKAVFKALPGRIKELREWSAEGFKGNAVGSLIDEIGNTRQSPVLKRLGLADNAVTLLTKPLMSALDGEINSRLDSLFQSFLPDALTVLAEEISEIAARVDDLDNRLVYFINGITKKSQNLAETTVNINGLALFDPAASGTVYKVYQAKLGKNEEQQAAEVVGVLAKDLVDALMPKPGSVATTTSWLTKPFAPGAWAPPIPDHLSDRLENRASQPFLSIHGQQAGDDVVGLLFGQPDPQQKVGGAAADSEVFHNIQEVLAQYSEGRRIYKVRKLLGAGLENPSDGSPPDELRKMLQTWTMGGGIPTDVSNYPDPFRIVMLEEYHKFSLAGSLDIQPLAKVKCDFWPTYHSRKDVQWIPVATEDLNVLKDAEQLVIRALLMGTLQLHKGYLELIWQNEPGVTNPKRRLPPDVHKAAIMVAFSARDVDGKLIPNIRPNIHAGIAIKKKHEMAKGKTPEEGAKLLVQYLNQQILVGTGKLVKGWDTDRASAEFKKYVSEDSSLYDAYLEVFPESSDLIGLLHKVKGDPKPQIIGGVFSEDGYYCEVCGGLVGRTELLVIAGNYSCEYFPDDELHPFGKPFSKALGAFKGDGASDTDSTTN